MNQASPFPLLTRDVPLHAILLLWGQFSYIPSTVFILGRTDAGSEVLAFILDTVMLLLVERYALTQGQYLGSIATDSAIWRSILLRVCWISTAYVPNLGLLSDHMRGYSQLHMSMSSHSCKADYTIAT